MVRTRLKLCVEIDHVTLMTYPKPFDIGSDGRPPRAYSCECRPDHSDLMCFNHGSLFFIHDSKTNMC